MLDEVDQGSKIEIVSCANGWCKVTFERGPDGYLLAEVVTKDNDTKPDQDLLPQPAASIVPNPPGPCFEALQTGGNGGKDPTRFCEKPSQ